MIGVSIIGNATLIAHDDQPILATDPWLGDQDPAYFGSWMLNHRIPADHLRDIFAARYLWFSHGHPDHLNPGSLERFRGRRILLPDHVNSRILKGLLSENYNAQVLPDRQWVQLSTHIKVQCITTKLQDAILIVDVKGVAFVNLNDTGAVNCSRYLRQLVSTYPKSYLLSISGYGDADMINFYDEDGKFVVPPAKNNLRVGEQLSMTAGLIGTTGIIPFSSHHQYQRTDSIWAQEYVTPLFAYEVGLSPGVEYVPPFSTIDCGSGEIHTVTPEPLIVPLQPPESFGDNWSDELSRADFAQLQHYFERKERVRKYLGFINFRVGGKDNMISMLGRRSRGITFSVPRNSLMQAIQHEIFDDLLIGNFMKTTLHGMRSLYDGDFNLNLTKIADNGQAQTESEVRAYLKIYKERAGREYVYDAFIDQAKSMARRFMSANMDSRGYRLAKRAYYAMR